MDRNTTDQESLQGPKDSRDSGLTPASDALRLTCCCFCFYRSELLVLPAPVQGWLRLCLPNQGDLKGPSAPKSLPRQKQLKFGAGVKTHREPVCVLLEAGNAPCAGSSWEGILTPNSKPRASCAHTEGT